MVLNKILSNKINITLSLILGTSFFLLNLGISIFYILSFFFLVYYSFKNPINIDFLQKIFLVFLFYLVFINFFKNFTEINLDFFFENFLLFKFFLLFLFLDIFIKDSEHIKKIIILNFYILIFLIFEVFLQRIIGFDVLGYPIHPYNRATGPYGEELVIGTLIIFIGMTIAVIYSLFKFRKKNDQIGDGIALEGNLSLEIVWTIIPSIIVLLIGLYSYNIYDRMGGMKELNHNHEMMSSNSEKIWAGISQTSDNQVSNNLSIEVSAMQFAFLFNYPKGNFISGELHVPVDQKVSMKMESKDVIHAFWVPEFRIKQDIIPGQPTILNFTPTKVGKYPIICAELCGPYHGGMRASIIVEEESDYKDWFNKNKKTEVDL